MVTNERNIGKVSISCDGIWDIRKDYDKLCLVTDGSYNYISRKQVPNGTDITNEEYWQKLYSVISTNAFYRIPGNIEDININTNPKGLEIVLGNYLYLKSAVLSNNIVLTITSILKGIIDCIDACLNIKYGAARSNRYMTGGIDFFHRLFCHLLKTYNMKFFFRVKYVNQMMPDPIHFFFFYFR